MNHVHSARPRPSVCGGFITTGTLLVAALSALVLMTGCHTDAAPSASTKLMPAAATTATVEAPRVVETMPHLIAYDEQFVVPTADDTEATQN